MSLSRLVLLSLVVLTSHFAAAQQPTPATAQAPQRDPQALAVLLYKCFLLLVAAREPTLWLPELLRTSGAKPRMSSM